MGAGFGNFRSGDGRWPKPPTIVVQFDQLTQQRPISPIDVTGGESAELARLES